MSCLIRYGDIALPLSCEAVCKDITFSDIATKKVKRKASVSKNAMFRSIISQAVANEFTLRIRVECGF